MLNAMVYCPKCGGSHLFEDIENFSGPEGDLIDNPGCKGFTRADLKDDHFGASNAEELAMGLYLLYHKGTEDGWEYMSREASDDVVNNFRLLSFLLCEIARSNAEKHGIGTVYYG